MRVAVAAALVSGSVLGTVSDAAASPVVRASSAITALADPAPVKDGKFTFKITKVTERTGRIGTELFGKKPQGKFVLVYVTVTNHGDEAQTFDGSSQKLLAGDKEYSADDEAALYLKSSGSSFEEINPGNSVRGVLVFDVPKSVQPTAIELHDSFLSDGVKSPLH